MLASGYLVRIPLFCAAPQAVALLWALRLFCRGVSSGDRFRWFMAELCGAGAACGGAPKGLYFSSGCRAAPRAAPGSQYNAVAIQRGYNAVTTQRGTTVLRSRQILKIKTFLFPVSAVTTTSRHCKNDTTKNLFFFRKKLRMTKYKLTII